MGILLKSTVSDMENANVELADLDETALIAAAKVNQDAFGEIYRRYVERIYNYIYYRTGNRDEAQDLTARVFHRAMKHIPNYQDKGVPFSAWLYRIARNLVANWHRDQNRRQMVSYEEIMHSQHGEGSPESLMQLVQSEEHLLATVRRLPVERQELLILKFLHELPNAEIGAIMDRSEGAIKSLYHRTLTSLREEFEHDQRVNSPKLKEKRKFNFRFWQRKDTANEGDEMSSDK
ncbi:MAG: RNA polymerase sigma factor [Candidatus Promineifilaceae bacterium]